MAVIELIVTEKKSPVRSYVTYNAIQSRYSYGDHSY